MTIQVDTGDKGLIPGSKDPLVKEMATDSSILAWEIPWTEEPGVNYKLAFTKSIAND